jgi:Holliday junction resolvasome RuvABC endonuclease subunit
MNIAGIDLSLTSTGYSINGDTGVIATKYRGPERLSIVSNLVLELIADNSVDVVIIEGYSFASRNSQAHSIGELGGCVRMRLWEFNVPFIDIPPTCRAKFATGKGNASKNEVISAISAKTGIVWSGAGSDDRCDAWILEQMGLAAIGRSTHEWPAENLSALEKIDWSPMDGLSRKTL